MSSQPAQTSTTDQLGNRAAVQRLAWLPFALLLWWTWSIALRPISIPDEGRYAGVARDMAAHGDWLVPRLNGLPFFHKPPLFYWIDASAMSLFGVGPATARIASAIAALIACWAVGWHARRVGGQAAMLATLLVLCTMPLYFFGGQYANLDMLVGALISAAIVCWAGALDPGATGDTAARRRYARIGWAAAALAILAKGLIGLVLPLLVLGPWALWHWRGRWLAGLRLLLDPLGLVIFALIVAPWFVAMAQRFPDFLDYFFIEQHFRRYLGRSFNNPQPLWFYPAVLAVLLLPWSLLLVAALRRRGQAATPASPFRSLWIWWAVAITLFFSAPASKLVGYILPAVPPLALLAGTWLAVPGRERWLRGGALLAALVCVGGVFGARQWDTKSLRELPPVMRAAAAADPAWRDVPMVFIEAPHFEVPLLLDAKVLPWVVKSWDDPKVQQVDSWPKELFDAARFDPEQGRRVLLKPQDLLARLCATPRAWILAPLQWKAAGDWIDALPEQAREREARLLRWDAANKGPAAPEQICQAGHGDQHQSQ